MVCSASQYSVEDDLAEVCSIQGRNRYESFCYPDGAGWKLEAEARPADNTGIVRVDLKLTKIGTVKLHLHRDMAGTIKTLTIKREGEHFYAIFTCEIGKPEPLPTRYEDVGIDLGVTHFAALSNGEFIDHPRYLRPVEKKLAAAQQALEKSAGVIEARTQRKSSPTAIARSRTNAKTFSTKPHASWSIAIKSSSLKTYRSRTSCKRLHPNRTRQPDSTYPMGQVQKLDSTKVF